MIFRASFQNHYYAIDRKNKTFLEVVLESSLKINFLEWFS